MAAHVSRARRVRCGAVLGEDVTAAAKAPITKPYQMRTASCGKPRPMKPSRIGTAVASCSRAVDTSDRIPSCRNTAARITPPSADGAVRASKKRPEMISLAMVGRRRTAIFASRCGAAVPGCPPGPARCCAAMPRCAWATSRASAPAPDCPGSGRRWAEELGLGAVGAVGISDEPQPRDRHRQQDQQHHRARIATDHAEAVQTITPLWDLQLRRHPGRLHVPIGIAG